MHTVYYVYFTVYTVYTVYIMSLYHTQHHPFFPVQYTTLFTILILQSMPLTPITYFTLLLSQIYITFYHLPNIILSILFTVDFHFSTIDGFKNYLYIPYYHITILPYYHIWYVVFIAQSPMQYAGTTSAFA